MTVARHGKRPLLLLLHSLFSLTFGCPPVVQQATSSLGERPLCPVLCMCSMGVQSNDTTRSAGRLRNDRQLLRATEAARLQQGLVSRRDPSSTAIHTNRWKSVLSQKQWNFPSINVRVIPFEPGQLDPGIQLYQVPYVFIYLVGGEVSGQVFAFSLINTKRRTSRNTRRRASRVCRHGWPHWCRARLPRNGWSSTSPRPRPRRRSSTSAPRSSSGFGRTLARRRIGASRSKTATWPGTRRAPMPGQPSHPAYSTTSSPCSTQGLLRERVLSCRCGR